MEKRGWLDKLQEGKEGERGGGGVFSLVNGDGGRACWVVSLHFGDV